MHPPRRFLRPALITLGVLIVVGVAALGGFAEAAPGDLTFDWQLAERFGQDADDDGIIDEHSDAGYLNPTSFTVTLDACDSVAAENAPPGATYSWRLSRSGQSNVNGSGCEATLQVPVAGTWNVLVRQFDSGGVELNRTNSSITVTDLLIVSIGDSVASGEGNPDTVGPADLGPFPFYEPRWNDRECHRSALAGPAQAALRMEQRDPHSSVTFLHLACSGATIQQGLLGSYAGIEPDPSDGPEPAQLARAIALAAGRPIDALVVSIGANDAKFSTIVETCLKFANCHNFTGIPGQQNAQQIFDANIVNLPGNYALLDDALDPHLAAGRVRNVFLTEYFDPSFADNGQLCRGATAPERDGNESPDGVVDGLSQPEWQFASNTVVAGLNAKVQAAVAASDDDGGAAWKFVDGIAARFGTHGYCARDRWVRTLFESFSYQHNQYGAFHPNTEGHLLGYAREIEDTVVPVLGVGGTALPFTTDPTAALAGDGLGSFLGALDALNAVSELADALPFEAATQIDAGIQKVFQAAADIQAQIAALSGTAGQTITQLDTILDDIDGDGDPTSDVHVIPGLRVDLAASIAPHLPATRYDVGLQLQVAVEGDDPILDMLADGLRLAGQPLDGGVLLDVDTSFVLEPGAAPAQRFRIPATTDLGSIGFGVSADFGNTNPDHGGDVAPLTFTAGIAQVSATGTLDADVGLALRFVDPNSDGVIDSTEMDDPGALFDLTCESTGARMSLDVTAGIPGLTGTVGHLGMDDRTLCDGPALPTVELAGLADLRNLTAADVINGLGQLATLLSSLQQAGDIDLPFIEQAASELARVNERLVGFFVCNGLTDPANPMANITLPPDLDTALGTVQQILPELALNLLNSGTECPTAQPGGDLLNLRYADGALLFDMGVAADPPRLGSASTLDVGDQLAAAGLTGLVSADGTAAVGVDVAYDVHATLGIDLRPGLEFPDRFFVVDGAGNEISLDVVLDANLDLTGRLGPLTATVADTAPGRVTLLDRRVASNPMLTIDVDGRGDDRLTLAEAAEAVADADLPLDIVVNGRVPATTLQAAATLAGRPLAQGQVTVRWNDVTQLTGPDGLQVAVDGSFADNLLPFNYNPDDPAAMIGELISAVRETIVSVRGVVTDDPEMVQGLPIIGDSAADLDRVLGEIQTTLDELIALGNTLTLDAMETEVERLIGEALDVLEPDRQSILDLSYVPAAGATRAAVLATLDLGICTADRDGPGCTLVVPNLATPISLDLGDSGVVGLGASGDLTASFDARAHLIGGVQLPDVDLAPSPVDPPIVTGEVVPFLDGGSSFTLGVGASATTALTATIGPVEVGLGRAGGEQAEFGLGVRYQLAHAPSAGLRLPVGSPAFDNFLAAIDPDASGGIHEAPDDAPTCGDPTPVDACANLPVYIGQSLLGTVTFRAPNALDPSTWAVAGFDEIAEQLTSEEFLFQVIVDGLQTLVDQLTAALEQLPVDQPVPLIGTSPAEVIEVIDRINALVDQAQDLVARLEAAATVGNVRTQIRQFFVDNLGPGTTVPLLLDGNDDGVVNANDVLVTVTCENTSGVQNDCTNQPARSISEIVRIQVQAPLGIEGEVSSRPFDLGFPGLRLATPPCADNPDTVPNECDPCVDDPSIPGNPCVGVSASAGFSFDLAFGLDEELGFFVPTGASPNELEITANVSLPDGGAGNAPDLVGDLAFLPVEIRDNHDGPDVELSVGVDLGGGGPDGLLDFQELGTATLTPTISACANLQLGLTLSAPEIDGVVAASAVPKLLADFTAAGGYTCDGSLGAPAGTGFGIEFENVAVEPGALVREFIGPVAHEARNFTRPLEPVVDAIRSPIPGVADAAREVGLPEPVWYDLFKAVDVLNPNSQPSGLQAIDRVVQLVDLVRVLDSNAAFDPNNPPAPIPLGSFTLDATAISSPVPSSELGELVDIVSANTGSLLNRLATEAGLDGDISFELNQGAGGGATAEGGLSFPALEEPTQLFSLLVGQDVPLVRFDAGRLSIRRGFSFEFPIGPFVLYIGGNAELSGRFAAGFDTFGLRQVYQLLTDEETDNDGLLDLADGLIQGLYIDDRDAKGADVPEITFRAELTAGAGVGIPGFSVGAEGGVRGLINLDLNDQDGRLRFDEMVTQIRRNPNPLCFFDASVHLDAFIKAVLRTPLGDISYPIADVVLLDEPDLSFCAGPPVPLGVLHPDGTLELLTQSSDDTLTVRTNAPGVVEVQTPEAVQSFSGVTRVFAALKGGRDRLEVTAVEGVTAPPTVACGGSSNDVLISQGPGSQLYGDAGGEVDVGGGVLLKCTNVSTGGRDTLTGSSGNDLLDGGGGNDSLYANGGGDTLLGLGGDDLLQPGTGNDSVDGGDGTDTFDYSERTAGVTVDLDATSGETGSGEADTVAAIERVLGGQGNDVLETSASAQTVVDAGPGDDRLNGRGADDVLLGGDGNDTFRGLGGNNQLIGGAGDDNFLPGSGGDTVVGQAGTDRVSYTATEDQVRLRVDGLRNDGAPDDQIDNLIDVDVITGTTGGDQIIGGAPGETINGLAGDDRLDGGGGDDVLNGSSGDDTLEGNLGADTLNGSHDDDSLNGSGGDDVLFGGNGDDVLRGGTEHDQLVAGLGNDVLDGEAGSDVIDGGGGDDLADYSVRTEGVTVDLRGAGCDGSALDAGGPSGCGRDDVRPSIERLLGGSGPDRLTGTIDDEEIDGGPGADTIVGGGGDDLLVGGDGNDLLFDLSTSATGVDSGDDVLSGGAGDDSLMGHGGADELDGGLGNDRLVGGKNADMLIGGPGNDDVRGLAGADELHGDDGNDSLDGGDGNDAMVGDAGNDSLIGGAGADDLDGGVGDDVLNGAGVGGLETGDGRDELTGGDGNDRLAGGGANDDLRGGKGDDLVEGGSANDTIRGDSGNDDLRGDSGDDRFDEGSAANGADRFAGGSGSDTVDYSSRSGTIVTTANGIADDGAPDEHDNIGNDVEVFQQP